MMNKQMKTYMTQQHVDSIHKKMQQYAQDVREESYSAQKIDAQKMHSSSTVYFDRLPLTNVVYACRQLASWFSILTRKYW